MDIDSPHLYSDRARFEDVDAMAMVYHPVYLSYLERARSQFLIDKRTSFTSMLDAGFGIVVAEVTMKFIRPLRLEENFFVASQIDKRVKSVLYMTQIITLNKLDGEKMITQEGLRNMKGLRFYAYLKLSVISLATKSLATPPPWIASALSPLKKII